MKLPLLYLIVFIELTFGNVIPGASFLFRFTAAREAYLNTIILKYVWVPGQGYIFQYVTRSDYNYRSQIKK